MTEQTMMIIVIAVSVIALICVLILIAINRGLNREVNALSKSYLNLENSSQELKRSIEVLKDDDKDIVQALNTSFTTFSSMISDNQKQFAENVSNNQKQLADSINTNQQQFANGQSQFHEVFNNRMLEMNTKITDMSNKNEERLEKIRETTESKMNALTEENSKQLEKMRDTVDEKLQKTLEDRISKSFQLVSERLEAVSKGLGEMQTLATGVGDLKKVLSNVKTRGILGEVQLGAILEQILAKDQYEEDVATIPNSKDRVEFAIKLPGEDGKPVYLPIDSKFPGETYGKLRDAYETGDKVQVEAAWKVLEQTLKKEAKDIHDKYVKVPHTTEFGIMFLPFEGLYAEVVNHGMLEILQRDYKINIAGPTTMAALLNSLQMGFRTLAIQKHSSEVWDILGAVKTEFETFEKALKATQNRIKQADDELEKLVGTRTRAINKKLKSVESLPDGEKSNLLDFTEMTYVEESSLDD